MSYVFDEAPLTGYRCMSPATSPSIIDRLVQRAQRLYSLPAVAMKVVQLTKQCKVDVTALRECVEKDPALTGKLLRVVNSSLFGLSRKVDDLSQAIALLGIKPLKLLVLGFSLPDKLLSGQEAEALGGYWRHTLIKAVAARQISEQMFDESGDDAFLAGLLQDIGMLVLMQELGDPYLQFLRGVSREGGDLATLETSTLGFDHAVLSARMLDDWGLPENLVAAVAAPFDEIKNLNSTEEQGRVRQTLHLAELLARFLTSEHVEVLDAILNAGGLYCNLTMKQLEALIESLEQQVMQLAEILSLDLPDGMPYATVLSSAYALLASAAEDATSELFAHGAQSMTSEVQDLTKCVERFAGEPVSSANSAVTRQDEGAVSVSPSPASVVDAAIDPGLSAHVASAVSACRQARVGLSLLLVEFDDFSTQLFTRGLDGAERAIRRLKAVIDRTHGGDGKVVILSDVRFAVILPDYERHPAVQLARQLLENVRRWSLDEADRGLCAISVSAGLATLAMPPKNFPAPELIEAAERCLSGAQLSGGDSVKSIDIC